MSETYYGFVPTPRDALLVMEACRRGLLPRVMKRLTKEARESIRSGSVFVYNEWESKIKRFTDGHTWSPSRISGEFLVYREVAHKLAPPRSLLEYKFPAGEQRGRLTKDEVAMPQGPLSSTKGTYFFLDGGLCKRTFSTTIDGSAWHLVAYYTSRDMEAGLLPVPSIDARLGEISREWNPPLGTMHPLTLDFAQPAAGDADSSEDWTTMDDILAEGTLCAHDTIADGATVFDSENGRDWLCAAPAVETAEFLPAANVDSMMLSWIDVAQQPISAKMHFAEEPTGWDETFLFSLFPGEASTEAASAAMFPPWATMED